MGLHIFDFAVARTRIKHMELAAEYISSIYARSGALGRMRLPGPSDPFTSLVYYLSASYVQPYFSHWCSYANPPATKLAVENADWNAIARTGSNSIYFAWSYSK